jgi:hypothetical protein
MKTTTLNAICPYFTMFPLDFPLRVIRTHSEKASWVLDPFCGRGTTNFAARVLGIPSVGIDCSPIAVAIAKAKTVESDVAAVINAANECLELEPKEPIPTGEFWELAYHPETLEALCRIRSALVDTCEEPSRVLLRALVLGALHGPMTKGSPSYFSNQSTRTFAPKPRYAVKYWRSRSLYPRDVDVMDVIQRRAERFLTAQPPVTPGYIELADSKRLDDLNFPRSITLVVTSPPYYGMKTYRPDQWIRNWFLGGSSEVEYGQPHGSLRHESPNIFVSELRRVWRSASIVCLGRARLVCRFGGICDRNADPLDLIKDSFKDTDWRVTTIRRAGSAIEGKRQASQFGGRSSPIPRQEFDVYAKIV